MPDDHDDHDDLHRGLAFDLGAMFSRRTVLATALGAGAAALLAACGDDDAASTSTAPNTAAPTSTTEPAGTSAPSGGPGGGVDPGGSGPGGQPPGGGGPGGGGGTTTTSPESGLSAVPEETAGPYPGDGSNGVNALTETGVVRTDITASFGAATGTADGVPITLRMTIIDVANQQPIEGAAVYVWHCDAEGRYSLYSQGATDENYLRGVQIADSDGLVSFTSIYPACYAGRWPHIHYEVYPSEASITDADNKIATSQLALPDDASQAVYADDRYPDSAANYSRVSLESDGVFSDGTTNEEPSVTGDVTSGYTLTITCPVSTS